VIRRVVVVALLVVLAGVMIWGGIHRTQAVLAKESGEAAIVQTHDPGEAQDTASGRGGGLHDGSRPGRAAGGTGNVTETESYTE
jgi:hypothetical protein